MKIGHRMTVAVVMSAALAGCGAFKGGRHSHVTPTVGERIPILGIQRDNTVDPTIATIPVTLPPAVANTDWAQPGGDAAKDIGHVALPATLSLAWTARVAGGTDRARLAAAPVVSNGRLYVVDTAARVHSFDARTGAPIWTTALDEGRLDRAALFGGGASVEGNVVYVTNGLGDVAALKVADGSVIWKKHPAGPLRGSPTVWNDNVYVMTLDNQIYALSAANGDVQWSKAGSVGETNIFGVAAPAAGQASVIAGYSTGELYAYRYENGRDLWSDALSRTSISTAVSSITDIDADPVIVDGRVYAVGQGGRMAAYDLDSGSRIWELNIASIATPFVAGDWIFVMTDDAKLLCVQRATGKIRWIAQLEHYRKNKEDKGLVTWKGPIAAGNRLIVVSSDGRIDGVDPATGAISQMFGDKAGYSLPPVVAGNMLYVLDDGGRIAAYR